MDYDQVLLLQKKFIGYHKILTLILVGFNLDYYFKAANYDCLYPSLVLLAILICEFVAIKMTPVRLKLMTVLKYAYICATVILVVMADNVCIYGAGIFCVMLYGLEYYLTLDFTEGIVRKVYLLTLAVPLFIGSTVIMVMKKGNILESSFSLCCMLVLFFTIMWLFAEAIAIIVIENDKKVFAQTRLIERINETNDELRIHQEKVKSTNELLGVQKIELQCAYEKINNVNEEMKIQNDILKYVSSSLEIGKLMTLITDSFVNRIGVDACAIVLKPGISNNRNIMYKIKSTLGQKFSDHFSKSIEDNCFEEIMEQAEVLVNNHVDLDQYHFIQNASIGSILIIPLIKQELQMGLLFVGTKKQEYFIENVDFFEGIVAQFIIALNNANLYQEMQSMAILDGLTGIYNRRYLTKLFNEYMYESINNRTPLSVALFDIDFFKRINDTYGHLFGDEIIKTIATIAKVIANENDGIVSRYGGEEFVIIFPNKGLEEAYPVVEKLHSEVKKLGIEHHGKRVEVNLSVGFTSFPRTCKDPRELLNRADWSMYYSKQHGRDQITVDSDEIQKEVALE